MNSKIQDLIDTLPIPQINISNQRKLCFINLSNNQFEIEFGEMILGPYSFKGTINKFIEIYFSQIAKINHYNEEDISKNIEFINNKNNNSYIYEVKDINFLLNIK